jgi:predicted dehydrogenase
MTVPREISRRQLFGHALGAAAAGIALPEWLRAQDTADPASAPAVIGNSGASPNEQIGVGIIGCGRRNGQLAVGVGGQGAPPKYARIVAVADLNTRRAANWGTFHKCPIFDDYRRLLDRKEVDVVVYATPEHWHYLPCIHAAQAGKDIYGEQPLSHTIREGRAMVEAVRKYNVVFQTGEQQRSNSKTRKAAELIINGRIGKVQRVIAYNYPSPFECNFPTQPIPEGLNWDRWCGPNEVVPYNVNLYLSRVPYEPESTFPPEPAEQTAAGPGWMSFRPYSGGELLNWGCHGLSMVQWALQMDKSGPVEVWVEPAKRMETFIQDIPGKRDHGDAVASRSVINYRYRNGVVLTLSSLNPRVGGGATFIGDKGEITIIRGSYECKPKGLDRDPLPPGAIRLYESDNHMQNFYDCVKSRKAPVMNIENAHRVATLCHLGNIARWLGRRLQWDPEKEVFPGDEEANGYLDIPRRKGYELPENV